MNPFALKHNDKELQLLRFLAMFGMGYYLFRTMKKEGTLGNAMNNPEAAKFKTQEFLAMAGKVAKNYIPPEARAIVERPDVQDQLTEIGVNIVDTFLGQKGNSNDKRKT